MKKRKSIRLKGYDYSLDNLYFITACVKNRTCCFGNVVKSTSNENEAFVQLSEFGQIAETEWHRLPEKYPYLIHHALIIMPNHIHGIIEINRSAGISDEKESGNYNLPLRRKHENITDPYSAKRTWTESPSPMRKIKSLSEIVGAYKTSVSKKIHALGYEAFSWQRNFYDHIIRNDTAYQNILNYIESNPDFWEEDELYTL